MTKPLTPLQKQLSNDPTGQSRRALDARLEILEQQIDRLARRGLPPSRYSVACELAEMLGQARHVLRSAEAPPQTRTLFSTFHH